VEEMDSKLGTGGGRQSDERRDAMGEVRLRRRAGNGGSGAACDTE
jgi:hypothetical protein